MSDFDNLFLAAKDGDSATLAQLINEQPDLINQTTQRGWTPLHVASFMGHLDCISLLLAAGADVHARTTDGFDSPAVFKAAANNDPQHRTEAVLLLLDHGSDVQVQVVDGFTLLHEAAVQHDFALATLLLERGIAVNRRKADGATPLATALAKGSQSVADLIRAHGGVE